MRRPIFKHFGLYDLRYRTMRRNSDGLGWCCSDEAFAARLASERGLVVVPVAVWQDHRGAIRQCRTIAEVYDLIAARTGWRLQ